MGWSMTTKRAKCVRVPRENGLTKPAATGPDDDDFESDTGELICALPDAIP